ncbi:glycosyltransferase DesVII [Actinoalloteichus hoggarensis]|uniref:Desosaminyl transferase EryCIII n=2 Tax=Actinoalloteichus hoggarensis TaxID=1470176 RepID=A0A221W4R6_9PSEU|nr:activator-dependent family glycosyltransferase [Actinoalloteichus hoggarensis]ASO20646.1 Desosaminyl transferase EryCIII precursor [Actinoalloteichus hoggarensis]MBB5923687.1 glycosyltransferase DesVII [Actinoalloteichus hoggarensis]
MRVLFVALPERSHVYCMTPLAWALRTDGHQVRVACSPMTTEVVTATGLPAVPLGTDPIVHESMRSTPESQENEFVSWSETDPERTSWEELYFRYQAAVEAAFSLYAEPLLADLVDYTRSWRPDLVVWDTLAFAGPVAAASVGAAHVRILWGADVWAGMRAAFRHHHDAQPPERRADPLAEWLARIGAPYGVEFTEELILGERTLDPMPPSLRLDTGVQRLPLRYVPFNGPTVLPDWLHEPAARPRVCLTLGTSNIEAYGTDYVSIEKVLAELADLDAEVIAAVTPEQRERLVTVPDNARIVDSIALDLLLPSCSAIIHHGGFGSYATALAHGVPQLVVSTAVSDHIERGRRLARSGAGVFLRTSETTPVLADRLRGLLADPGARRAAELLRDEVAAMPSPNAVVARLEDLVAARRSPTSDSAFSQASS